MKIKIGEGMKKSDGTFVHTVYVGEEKFDEVPNIKKYQHCNSDNCRYYRKCSYDDGVVRTFDCQKNRNRVITIYNTITGAIAAIYFCWLVTSVHPGFFKGAAFLIFGLLALDVICTIIEVAVPKLRDKRFYRFLKRVAKREAAKKLKEKEKEDAENAAKEFEKIANSPYYKDVINASTLLNTLKRLSDEYDFGKNDEKIEKCVEKVAEIIEVLKKDSSGYVRVAFLFEGSLKEFYNALNLYTCFLKADIHEERNERVLTDTVNNFYEYLSSQKVEAILDKNSIGIQFRSSAEALGTMIKSKGEN